jgi:hypothetical protein
VNSYDRFVRVILPVGTASLLLTLTAVGWVTQSGRFVRGYAPEQPVAYSHRLHAGTMKIPCQYCHSNASRSRHAGVPAVETCMNCHRVTKTESASIQMLTAIYESGRSLKWKRIHALPDHVYFDHRPHVSMRMGNCLGCHRDAHAALPAQSEVERGAEYCNACHR